MDSNNDSIKHKVSDELYNTICNHYESGSYSNAIIDGLKHLTSMIRSRSKQDGDGASLVGSAFGGQKPIIAINGLKSTSEWDEQKGFEQILRGLYQGIRNPRTHETYNDSKEVCDQIIGFIEYIESVIVKNTNIFNIDEYKVRVFDPLFVAKRSYAEEIFKYLPEDKVVELFELIFNERQNGNADKLKIVLDVLYNRITELDQPKLYKIISKNLRNAKDSTEFISILRYLNSNIWNHIDVDAKMRAESSMIDSISVGYYDQKCSKGQLGTWATTFCKDFTLTNEIKQAITGRLLSNWYGQNYIAQYFFEYLPNIFKSSPEQSECCDNLIYAGFENKSNDMRKALRKKISWLPKEWKITIIEKAKKYQESDSELFKDITENADDLPF